LLTLARVEADAAPATQRVELRAVAQRAIADVAPAAVARQQTISLDADAACAISGDQTLLEVLVRNLVDNAVRYSPDAAQVHVRVAQEAGQMVLSVEDSGPGLADSDLQRLGERFFRVTGTNESGSGLGWSIVRRIAAVYRGQVSVERSKALGGLAVRVAFKGAP
jgi:two-component system sensor histidine kinase QseC